MSSAWEISVTTALHLLPVILVVLALAAVAVAVGVYVYRDARSRRMNAGLWALIAIFAPCFMGLIVYLLVRGNYSDLRCPGCAAPIREEYVVCPNCATKLRACCPKCGAAVEQSWKVCPMCMEPLPAVQPDIHPAVEKKDISLVKVLALAIGIPLALIVLLVAAFVSAANITTASTAIRETEMEDYQAEMEAIYANDTIARRVMEWAETLEAKSGQAYALRYDREDQNEHYYLLYVPGAQGSNRQNVDIDSSVFGTTVTVELMNTGRSGSFFNMSVTAAETPNLKVVLGGEKLNCQVTEVDYNPTVFYIVPQYDEIEQGDVAEVFLPERLSVVKLVEHENAGEAVIVDETTMLKVLAALDGAPYLELEHPIYERTVDQSDGFVIVVEYQIHENMVLHDDMLTCFVVEQEGSYYIIDQRFEKGCFIRQTTAQFYEKLLNLFEVGK